MKSILKNVAILFISMTFRSYTAKIQFIAEIENSLQIVLVYSYTTTARNPLIISKIQIIDSPVTGNRLSIKHSYSALYILRPIALSAADLHKNKAPSKTIRFWKTPVQLLLRELFSEEIPMLLRSEGIDLAAPESKFAACNFLVDLQWNIVYHLTRLTADLFTIIHKILRAERLYCE